MQKRIQSCTLPQTWPRSYVPISFRGAGIHTANSQDRNPRDVPASPFPYSLPLVSHLSPHPHDSCPTRMHIHHLLPEACLQAPLPTHCPQAIRAIFLISTHTHYSLIKTSQWCPITFRPESNCLRCLLRPFWIWPPLALPTSSLLPTLHVGPHPSVDSSQTHETSSLVGAWGLQVPLHKMLASSSPSAS